MKLNKMTTKILVTIITLLLFIACKKNTYNTKPTLQIKSMNGNVFPNGSTLILQIQVTDKEGDVTDSLFMRRVRYNQKTRVTLRDSLYFKVPDAPNSPDGIIQLELDYNNYLAAAQSPIENDTIAFKFALKDKADNVSDTITTDTIVVIR